MECSRGVQRQSDVVAAKLNRPSFAEKKRVDSSSVKSSIQLLPNHSCIREKSWPVTAAEYEHRSTNWTFKKNVVELLLYVLRRKWNLYEYTERMKTVL